MSKKKKYDATFERNVQLQLIEMSRPTTEEAIEQFKKMLNSTFHHSVQYLSEPDSPLGDD
jgi:hypothetical protein